MLSRGAPAVEKSATMASRPTFQATRVERGGPPKGNMPLNERPHHLPEDKGREHFVVDNG